MGMKTWNVYKEDGTALGQVQEDSESNARCAALSKFSRGETDDATDGRVASRFVIEPDEDFSVSQA